MRHRRFTILAIVLAAVAFVGSPALAQGAFDAMPLSKELAYGTYMERVGRVEVIVGTYLAALEEAGDYIPFRVAIGVWGKGPELTVRIENFEVHDSTGNVYQAATPEQVGKSGLNQMIRAWRKDQPFNTGNEFETSHPTNSDFYPDIGVTSSEVHVGRESFFKDVIYFPKPEAGLEGEMLFSFYTDGMKDGPVNVKIKTPPMKKEHKKKAEEIRKAAS